MNQRRLWAVARKEFIHIIRDPRSLAMAIAMPVMMMLLYGYALTLDVDNVPLVVWDQSQSQASREYISHFTGSRYFSLRSWAVNYEEVERSIDRGKALVALIIPRDFAGRVESGRAVAVQLMVDGSDSTTGTLAMAYAEAVTFSYANTVSVQHLQRQGATVPALPLDFRLRVWFNTDLESKNYIVPGLIAVIMMVIAALLTSQTIAREWERGTMEQLVSTPVKGRELILGKLIPYFTIGFVDVLLTIILGEFLFHVPMRGSFLLLLGLASIFLMGTMAFGIFISAQTKNQLLANQAAMVLTFVPSFLLSGFVFPISNMPKVIQVVTLFIPARYFISLLKAIYLKGLGLQMLAGEAALMIVYGMVMVFLAHRAFKKKLG